MTTIEFMKGERVLSNKRNRNSKRLKNIYDLINEINSVKKKEKVIDEDKIKLNEEKIRRKRLLCKEIKDFVTKHGRNVIYIKR